MLRPALLFIFMLITGLCFAGPDTAVVLKKKPAPVAKAVLKVDTGSVIQRKFNEQALKDYSRLPEFKYTEGYSGPSLWSRFWKWFWNWLDLDGKNAGKTTWFFRILKYLFIIGGPAAVVFLILKLSGINVLSLFRKKPYSPMAYSESVENIHEINFEEQIEKAVSVHNYRLAVRLLYLKSLKQLSDNGLINWQPDKTNTHYVQELTNIGQRDAFKDLTLQFEYVWYGDFTINSEIYKRISQLFGNFKSNVA